MTDNKKEFEIKKVVLGSIYAQHEKVLQSLRFERDRKIKQMVEKYKKGSLV